MTDKEKKIREVMEALKENKTVKIDNGLLWLGRCRVSGRLLIFWEHFGQSANRCNIEELTWIINIIFEKKRKNFNFSVC